MASRGYARAYAPEKIMVMGVHGVTGALYGVPPIENHDDGRHLTPKKKLFFDIFGALGLLRGVRGPFSDPNKPITTSWDAHMTDF